MNASQHVRGPQAPTEARHDDGSRAGFADVADRYGGAFFSKAEMLEFCRKKENLPYVSHRLAITDLTLLPDGMEVIEP